MNFSKRLRQITVDAHDERHARNPGHGAAYAAGVADRRKQRGEHADKSDPQHRGAHGDRLKHPALWVHLHIRNQRQHGERADNVNRRNQGSRAENGARQRPPRVADFRAHRRNEFESGEGKHDLRPEIHRVPIPVRHHVCEREVRQRALLKPQSPGYSHKNEQRQIGAHAACVLQPFPHV